MPSVSPSRPQSPIGDMLIVLPTDRVRPGRLTLAIRGHILFTAACLGRSAGLFDRFTGTGRHDRLAYRGDTPLGDYAVTFVSHLAKAMTGIDTLWIGLDPTAGEALQAEHAGRRGLGIHGGRGNTFMPTHGCIRLRDKDMAELAAIAGRMRFTVSIREGVAA